MIDHRTLLTTAEKFCAASEGLQEKTLSYRIFGDTKKFAALRDGADITVGRFNAAMRWFAENWPADAPVPVELKDYRPDPSHEDAA